MSVVIVGGNERMERRYKDLCEDFQCRAKVFTKPRGGLRDKVGSPDLMIFFTDTMSHKMLLGALSELRGGNTIIEHCPESKQEVSSPIITGAARRLGKKWAE